MDVGLGLHAVTHSGRQNGKLLYVAVFVRLRQSVLAGIRVYEHGLVAVLRGDSNQLHQC